MAFSPQTLKLFMENTSVFIKVYITFPCPISFLHAVTKLPYIQYSKSL